MSTISSRAASKARPFTFAAATYVLLGSYFGLVLMKAEVVSWYRVQEMFRFQSFHMYGVIGSAVLIGALSVWLIKRFKIRALDGSKVTFTPKAPTYRRYLLGGSLFGLGWAMTGACPAPVVALVGAGLPILTVVFVSALIGTWTYGALRHLLPH